MSEETVLRKVIGYNGTYRLEKFTTVLLRHGVGESRKPATLLHALATGNECDELLEPNIKHDESTNTIFGDEKECYIPKSDVPGNTETLLALPSYERYVYLDQKDKKNS